MSIPAESLASSATYVIRSASDLSVLRGPHPLPRSRWRRIHVDIAGVPWDRIKAWEARLNATANACGCSEGATAAVIGAGAGVLAAITRDNVALTTGIGIVVVGALIGGMIGKAIGLRRAQSRFRRAVSEIEQAFETSISGQTPGRG